MVVMDDLISTREAAALLGVGPTAIKRWADTGELPCLRTAGGHRRFRRRDLAALIQRRAEPESSSDRAQVAGAAVLPAAAPEHLVDLSLAEGGAYRAEGVVLQLRGALGSWVRAAEQVGEALVELGRRWELGDITVMEEHLASARLARALARIAASIPVPPGAPRALLVAAPDEEHTLGLGLVELCLLEAGWQCRWAGRATPVEEVVTHVEGGEVEMVVASASPHSTDAARLAQWTQIVGDACERAAVALVVGGRGAWPERLAHGVRLRDFEQLNAYLAGVKARHRR